MTGEDFLSGALDSADLEAEVWVAEKWSFQCRLVGRPRPGSDGSIDIQSFGAAQEISPLNVGIS